MRDQILSAAEPSGTKLFTDWLEKHGHFLGLPMDESAFRSLCTNELRELIGHRTMLAAVGYFASKDIGALHAWNFDCPADLFETMTSKLAATDQPTLVRWLQTQQPLFIESSTGSERLVERELAARGLGCRAIHGVVDGGGSMGTCLVFFGISPERRDTVVSALRFVVPSLHAALMHLCRLRTLQVARGLTPRERQLVSLICEGQTNPQIATAWSRSEKTVRNQLRGLMAKLNVSRRAELAVVAMRMGLLDSGVPVPATPPHSTRTPKAATATA